MFRAFDPRTRRYFQEWLHDAGIASTGEFASDLNDSLGNAAPFFKGGADLLRPLDEQEVALRRVVRDTGRSFHAISRENGQLRGLITNGEATFSALSARDDALAETFQILPTFLRETRTTVGRLEQFARNTDPLVRDLREPADDLAPTVRDLGDLSPDLEQLFNDVGPLVDASATGVPAATRFLRGAEPVLASTHTFLRRAQPDPGLPVLQPQPAQRVPHGRWAGARRDGRRRLQGQRGGRALPAADGDHRRALAAAARPRGRHGSAATPTWPRTPTRARSRSA